MSNDPKIPAARRDAVGTTATKKVRQAGRIPGNIYGHKQETISFSVENDTLFPVVVSGHKVVDFELDGQVEKAIIQEVQWDTFSKEILHFDLLRVDENERVTTVVELAIRGIAPGVLAGGILEQTHHTLPIECPVIRLPERIVVRVNNLKLGESILVKDLELPPEVTTSLPDEEVVVHIVVPKKRGDSEEAEATEETAETTE